MKATRIVSLALITFAAAGFNAYAQSNDAGVDAAQNFVSTASVAQVRAEGVQSNLDRFSNSFSHDGAEYLSGKADFMSSISRDAVRSEALKAYRTITETEAG
jgi:hypothetical protein